MTPNPNPSNLAPTATAGPDPAASPASLSQPHPKPIWKLWHTVSLVAMIIAILLLGLLIPPTQRLWAWIGTLVLLAESVELRGVSPEHLLARFRGHIDEASRNQQ